MNEAAFSLPHLRGRAGVGVLAVLTLLAPTARAETCHYSGAGTYNGRLTALVITTITSGVKTIDARLQLDATPWRLWPVRFLIQEKSTWLNEVLQSVAVNSRQSSNGTYGRQYWDLFLPTPDGLQAYRIQVKREADLQRRHPAFAHYWNPSTFAQPWEQTFQTANPDRRPDLDLPTAQKPFNLQTPLALALYTARRPLAGQTIQLFLPGWKKDARLTATLTHPNQASPLTVLHPNLTPTSFIDSTPNPHTLHAQLETPYGSAEATLTQTTCISSP